MSKIIAVMGASGTQGGGVVNIMIQEKGWKVRALTRNPNSDAGKALQQKGVEVVAANADDESSLEKAFEGCHAIFAVTNFWEHLFQGKTQDESGSIEEQQAQRIALAASKSSTLEHYVWSTLPDASGLTGGKHKVPHCDYKAKVDNWIRKELPDLAKKTTYLYFGYYPSNMAFFPTCKPFEMPGAYGKYVQLMPTPATAKIPVSGDMNVTPGLWVRAILAKPQLTHGKYALVATDIQSFGQILDDWSKVTGKQAVYVRCSHDEYEKLWGIAGLELAVQFEFGEEVGDWSAQVPGGYVSKEELGIQDAPGTVKALENLKSMLV